jgi:DNA-binding MarR family transcriptional regulator
MDLIRDLRALAFASRLKRLGDRLKAEATLVYEAGGIDFNDSWFLVAVALSRKDRIAVTEMAAILGVSHAAVSQMATAMERAGYVTSEPDSSDRRRTLLCLTGKGQATIEALMPLWHAIGHCTEELIDSTGQNLLLAITQIENELNERCLFDRVSRRMRSSDR